MAHNQQDYNAIASQYDSIESLPHSRMSEQLVQLALGDCHGEIILDIGGGSGLHARNAIAKGATRVDNVDLSPEMLRNSDVAERAAGRTPGERVAGFVGDATKPFDRLNLPGKPDAPGLYDVVMVIWTFDHATTPDELEAMWRNVATHCRPGGRIIRLSSHEPRNRQPEASKYGVKLSEFEDVPGGVRYRFTVGFDKPFTAVATNMEANYSFGRAREMAKKFGFDDLVPVPVVESESYRSDSDFWQSFAEHPSFLVAVGTKIA